LKPHGFDLAEQNLVLEALEVFTFSKRLNSPEQMEIQRKINAFMDMNNMGRARQNPGKQPNVWYE
jgi:hypothetical protein